MQCFARKMITTAQKDDLRAKPPREQRDAILDIISQDPRNFAKFREILRSYEIDRYSDILKDLDLIHVPPA